MNFSHAKRIRPPASSGGSQAVLPSRLPFYYHFSLSLRRLAVHRICTLRSDLSHIRRKRFRRITNNSGQEFYDVKFNLRMSVVDEVLKLELVFQGRSYGTVSAKYDD
jgi:hypothetical protein